MAVNPEEVRKMFTHAVQAEADHVFELLERGSRPCLKREDGQHLWVRRPSAWAGPKYHYRKCIACGGTAD